MRPRMRLGLYSAVSVSTTGTSPPRPKFEMNRYIDRENTLPAVATRPVKTEKIPMVAENDVPVDNAVAMVEAGKKDVIIVAGGGNGMLNLFVRPEIKSLRLPLSMIDYVCTV